MQKKPRPMNQQQRKFIRDELAAAYRRHSSAIWEAREVQPAKVKAASKIVSAFADKRQAEVEKKRAKLRKEEERVKRELLFGDPQLALRALDSFKALKF
jgi:hypothetical protein